MFGALAACEHQLPFPDRAARLQQRFLSLKYIGMKNFGPGHYWDLSMLPDIVGLPSLYRAIPTIAFFKVAGATLCF